MNQAIKTKASLIEIVKHDPARDYASTRLAEPRKRIAIGTHKAGEIVRRGLRYWRVEWTLGPVMRLSEYQSWRI